MNKHAFSTTKLGNVRILTIGGGTPIFIAKSQSFNDMYPELDRALRIEYNKTVIERAIVVGSNPTGDGKSYDITAVRVDEYGKIIPSEDSTIRFQIRMNQEVDADVWSDNEEAIKTICAKSNRRDSEGMLELIDKLQACVLECDSSSRGMRKAKFKNEALQLNDDQPEQQKVIIAKEKSGESTAEQYFDDTKEESKKED